MLPKCLWYMEISTQDNQPSAHNVHCHIGVHHQSQSCNILFKHWIMYVHGSQSESMYIRGIVDICKGVQLPAVMILPQTMLMSIMIKGFYRNTQLCKHQPCNMFIKLRYDLKLWKTYSMLFWKILRPQGLQCKNSLILSMVPGLLQWHILARQGADSMEIT